jgi:peptidoglycan hydrolase-like protein with peptidoglycan-binding domain
VPRAVPMLLSLVLAASLVALAGPARAQTGGGTEAAPAPQKVSVKRIQRALGVRADGVIGPQTRRAIKRFQRRNGLPVTGRADTATLTALGLIQPVDPTLSQTDPASILAQIAQCESGGDITAVSADGRYRGKYQFSRATWEALGGTGDPAEADEATQDALALQLYQERGTAPWPSCSKQLGLED